MESAKNEKVVSSESNQSSEIISNQSINQNPLEKLLECSLCLSLICEPLTTPCGHSFCRICLHRSLKRFKQQCPTCRSVCHINPEDANENVMIKAAAILANNETYQARLIESLAEKQSWALQMPIFYYNQTLFPGSTLKLHLFEPRYKLMMQRIVNGSRKFAYVPNFSTYQAQVGDVALVASLESADFIPDGRCLISAKIESRVEIVDHFVEQGTQGLHYCRVREVHDEPMSPEHAAELEKQRQKLVGIFENILRPAGVLHQMEKYHCPMPVNSSLEKLTLWIAAVAPFAEQMRFELLRTRETWQRFVMCQRSILRMLSSEAIQLQQIHEVTANNHVDIQDHRYAASRDDSEDDESSDADEDDDEDAESENNNDNNVNNTDEQAESEDNNPHA